MYYNVHECTLATTEGYRIMAGRGHLHVTIDPEVLQAARAKRRATGRSMSHVVEAALRRWITEASSETIEARVGVVEKHRVILLVDDDPLFLKAMQTALDASGYDVVNAKGRKEALALLKPVQPFELLRSIERILGSSVEPLGAGGQLHG